jgi:hypothetical protein
LIVLPLYGFFASAMSFNPCRNRPESWTGVQSHQRF